MAEKIYTLHLGEDNRTDDFQPDMLEFIVNTLLSKPCSKRMRDKLDGVYSITEILSGIFGNSDPNQTMTVSNGTYVIQKKVSFWMQFVAYILAEFTEDNCKIIGFKKTAESASARELVAID